MPLAWGLLIDDYFNDDLYGCYDDAETPMARCMIDMANIASVLLCFRLSEVETLVGPCVVLTLPDRSVERFYGTIMLDDDRVCEFIYSIAEAWRDRHIKRPKYRISVR